VIVVGAFYLLTAASQSLGYGATAAGAKAFGAACRSLTWAVVTSASGTPTFWT
jgi:hypothetical protein